MPSKSLSYPDAIIKVMSAVKRPLSLFEIEREIVRREFIKTVRSSSIRHAIYKDLEKGTSSLFFQVDYNLYTLRSPEIVVESNNDFPVLVFNAEKLKRLGYFNRIKKEFAPYVDGILRNDDPLFIPRLTVEEDVNYKQVVSYALIMYKKRLLRFTRHEYKRNRNLDLVDGKYSLGFGGHVQFEDFNLFTINDKDSGYGSSLLRELKEETGIEQQDIKDIRMIGVLNDDTTPKGKCHFAFLHLVELANPKFKDVEKWVIKPELVSFEQIIEEFENYEYWSKLCLQHFFSNELEQLEFKCYVDNKRGIFLKKNIPHLAIVGEIGSGKSQICSLFVEQYGFTRIPCSQILRDAMHWSSRKGGRRELQDAGYKFINKKGAHKRFAKKIAEYIRSESPGKTVLIDGLRYKESLIELQKVLGVERIPIVYVANNRDNQHKNFLDREKSELKFEDFLRIVEHPVESSIDQFVEDADVIIYNVGDLKSLRGEVSHYLQKEPSNAFLVEAWDNNAVHRHNQILKGVDLTFDKILSPYFVDSLQKHTKFPSLKILDVGCGSGVLTDRIADRVKQVTGIDHSCVSIQIAKEYSSKKNISFQCESIENFVLDEHYDVVIANMTFHSVDNIEQAIKNIYSSLKHGGLLIFSLPHPRYYPERERLRDVFGSSGYEYSKQSFYRIPFTISLEAEPLPSLIPYFHRPINFYETLFSKVGFWILELYAPMPNEELKRKYRKTWETPHLLMGIAKKP
jgi:2-polyprenyl-3-methyl-5-hydroxy-6-metoxy-1,4-benzoquinol methylase/predicted NUDIX family phosphoesterase/dephospho-CoA kinase